LLGGLLPSIHAGAVRFASDLTRGDVVVTGLPFTNSTPIDSKLPDEAFDALTAVDGVGAVNRVYSVTLRTTTAPINVTAADRFSTVGGALRAGALPEDDVADGEAIIGTGLARARSLRVGDAVAVDGIGGRTRLAVRAGWDSGDLGGNAIYVNRSTMESIWGSQPVQYAIVEPADGVTADQLRDQLRSARTVPWMRVLSSDEVVDETATSVSGFLRPFWFLVGAMLLVSLLTVSLTVSLSIVRRARDALTVEALGLTRARIARLVLAQTLAVTVCVCVLAALIAVVALWPTTLAAGFLFGLEPPYRLSLWPFAVAPLLGCAVTLAAAWLGLRLTSSPSVTAAISGGAS
jgi:ABC-type antimicrobial peptide transport system permease subunit